MSRRVRELVRPHRRRVVLLAAESLVGGLIEATFLVVVTRVALAIADDRGRAGIVASWYVSIPTAVGMAAILLVVRLGLALLAEIGRAHV